MYVIGLMVLVASTTLLAGPVISKAGGERKRYQGRGISRVDDREGWGNRDNDRAGRHDREGDDREYPYEPNIPAGHLPPPGHCRDWEFDRPAGHQPLPYKC